MQRVVQLVVVLGGVSLLTFLILNLLPGDPGLAVLGDNAPPEALEAFRSQHGLDRALHVRYFDWVSGAVTGDLGTSFRTDQPVLETILDRVPVSLQIVVFAQILALLISVPAAIACVWKPRSWLERTINTSAFATISVPNFLAAYVLILIFAVHLGWLPATGFSRLSNGVVENLRSIALPTVTLALSQFGIYTRVLRSDMVDTLEQDYVTTAYGKGLTNRRILVRHVLRGSLLSLVTVVGVNMGVLLGGAVITETIFAIPGIGRLMIEGIAQRDLMVVQGVVLLAATAYVVLNLIVDVLYTALDPRIELGGQRRA
ncbi:ABC transporter permease [Acidimicrobiia bacterium EGI L10123]|uniref:ABC transporter permease n=1 Tax=Salinilacustrithrix flava TaxID=2957203 RepID=UPI003D7C2FAC|nr:ABC transporter permease [Acidimicrobiia bacterium EGI L10123]